MIPARKSGIAFSINPLTGSDNEVLIEACFGLGEAVVSGLASPDLYRYNWLEDCITETKVSNKECALFAIDKKPYVKKVRLDHEASQQVLTELEIYSLSRLVIDIQQHYGYPVDVEWAYHDGEFYIVQARPITTINFNGIEGIWSTADFKDGGVSSTACTPMMWSLYDFVWENTLPDFLSKIKLLTREEERSSSQLWASMFFARPYWNLGLVKNSYSKLPGYVERSFDEDLGIEICYEGNGVATGLNLHTALLGIQSILAFKNSLKEHVESLTEFKAQQDQRLKQLDQIQFDVLTTKEKLSFFKKFIHVEYLRNESTYFNHIFHTSVSTSLFKEFFNSCNTDISVINLFSGLTNIAHLGLNDDIWKLSRSIRNNKNTLSFWISHSCDELIAAWRKGDSAYAMDEASNLIKRHRFRSTHELDISIPCYDEEPSFIFSNIKQNVALTDEFNPGELSKNQHTKYCEAAQMFYASLPMRKRKKAAKQLEQIREMLWWREELRNLSTQYYYYVRRFLLKLFSHFSKLGLVEKPSDMFFLKKDQLIKLIDGELSVNAARTLINKNRRYYNSFTNFTNPNEIGSQFTGINRLQQKGKLEGLACSPGVVEGQARVIENITDAQRIQQDDILITKFTDPGWTPKFSFIKAVATETGGVLSHAAVIAREYGIPAVLAIPGLTSTVKDGDYVRIDGDNGIVRVIKTRI